MLFDQFLSKKSQVIWSKLLGDFHSIFAKFWRQHPALLYGLAVFLGAQAALQTSFAFFIPVAFLFLSSLASDQESHLIFRPMLAFLIGISAFFSVTLRYEFPDLPREGVKGVAHFAISSVVSSQNHFGRSWIYKGTISSFVPDIPGSEVKVRRVPCRLILPYQTDKERPLANSSYYVHGSLKESLARNYTFNVKKDSSWIVASKNLGLAEYRYRAKEKVTEYIHTHMNHPRVASFLSGIVTGDFDDRLLSMEFGRFGIQHIMAISGFHFNIITAIFGAFLRLFCSRKLTACLLIFLLSAYFVFLGLSASVLRAWLTILIFFGGHLWEKKGFALNSLGIALLVSGIIDPLMGESLSFQFSFLTTSAILLFCAIFNDLLEKLFEKRPLSETVEMNLLNQHGYVFISFMRQSIALALAVNVIACPFTLFYFHKFPLLSFLFNLFFPFLVSISMLLLCAALILGWIPFLSDFLHFINHIYTYEVLSLTFSMPENLDFYLRTKSLTSLGLIVYLTFVLAVGILWKGKISRTQENQNEYMFF